MKTVNICKAQQTIEPVESRTIVIDREIPVAQTLAEAEWRFQKESLDLADALCSSLPGGTLDRLIARLMERKASLFAVPLFTK